MTTAPTGTSDTIVLNYASNDNAFNDAYFNTDSGLTITLSNVAGSVAAPTVTGVSPSTGSTGGTTSVVITGTGFSSATGVNFGGVNAASFTINSATQITAVPLAHAAGTVDVTVLDAVAGTTSATSSADHYTYAAPTVTSVSPTSIAAGATTAITINGSNFAPTATVTVGGTAATGVSFVSATQLTATAPSKSAGTYDVVVTTGTVSTATSSADQITYVAAPTAGAVSATVAFNSTSNSITLNLGGGTATSVAVSTAASHGTATASGTGITYTPTAGYGGSDSFSYTASNTGGTSTPATVTITVSPPTITVAPTSLPAATVGAAYSQTLTASGGTSTYAFAVTAGALPAGLTLSGGVLSGTPTAAGSFNVTITATDSSTGTGPFTGSRAYTLTVGTPTIAIAPSSLPAATLNVPYSQTITASGGTSTYTFAVASGALPPGLLLSSGGVLSGTPTSASSFNFTVTAQDSSTGSGAPFSGSRAYTLVVGAGPPTATQAVASTILTVNHAASAFTPVTGSGGTAPLTYSVSPGLPTGLTLDAATGAITGTPTAASATTTYTVTVTDAVNATATDTFDLTVNGAVTATQSIASKVLTQNVAATSFTPVTGSGGTAPLAYSISPSLPTGLSLASATGAITGTPSATSAATTYTVTVTDATSATASNTFSLTVNNAVTATQAIASKVLTQNVAASAFTPVTGAGGTSPLAFSVSPSLPTGLSLSTTTGQVTGTPSATSAATTYTVTVTDANSATASNTFSLTVNGAVTATQAIASKVLAENTAASAFTPVTGGGGTAPLAYSVSPSLPTGLSLSATTGQVTGTPSATSATTTYTVTVTDANSATATNTFDLTVNGAVTATQAIASKTLTQNAAATAFTPVTGAGGTAPLSFSISPALPSGLALASANGVITGTPTATSAAATFTVTVTDANSATASNTFSLTVAAPAPTLSTISPNTGVSTGGTPVTLTGTDFTGATSVTIGGTAATNVTVVSPTSITATTPAGTAGAASVVVTTPSGANAGNALFTYTLPVVTVTALSPSSGTVSGGTAVTITGTAFTGATAVKFGTVNATSFSVTSATSISAVSPAGSVGPVDVTVTAASVTSPTGSADTFTYTGAPVAQPVTVTAPGGGGPFTITPVLTGGPATSVAIPTPPSHGTATPSGTTITYTPAPGFIGTDTFTYTASNSQGTSAPATITVTVTHATTTISLTSPTLSTVFGVPVTLSARVVGSAPTGTIAFAEGANVLRTAPLSGSAASFTVTSLSIGRHVFVATYSGDANNIAATSRVLAISIAARSNPALNTDVVGLVTAEVSTATRFGQTQINNTFHRLEELHDEDDAAGGPKSDPDGSASTSGHAGGIGSAGKPQPVGGEDVQTGDASPAAFGGARANTYGSLGNGPLSNGAEARLPYSDLPSTIRPDSQNQAGRAFQALSGQAIPATFTALNKRGDLPFHLWFAGAVDYGSLTGDGSTGNRFAYSNSFTTSGLTFGADRRFFNGFKAGVAIGVGFDHTSVGTDGTKSDAHSYNATLYASYRVLPHTYVDAIAGYGRLGFNLNRWSTDGNVMLNGTRRGSDVFGSLVLTHDIRWGAWRVSPYSRVDVVRVDLDAYTEAGSDIWALHYNELETPTISAVVGTRLGYTIPVSWGTLTPMVRMEYSHALSGTYNQTLSYADLPGTTISSRACRSPATSSPAACRCARRALAASARNSNTCSPARPRSSPGARCEPAPSRRSDPTWGAGIPTSRLMKDHFQ